MKKNVNYIKIFKKKDEDIREIKKEINSLKSQLKLFLNTNCKMILTLLKN